MGRLFGTDGVRGCAGTHLTARLAFDLGIASAKTLTKSYDKPVVLIGMDTRISCEMLVAALTAGICSVGVDVYNAGVVPTPAVAYLVRKYGFSAGIMVSASHNAFDDNGIKFYNGQGLKLSDEIENEIETAIGADVQQAAGADIGRVYESDTAIADYAEFLHTETNTNLTGLKIALDCANGATYIAAPHVFGLLDADISIIANMPDGVNINKDCGSTHISALAKYVKGGNFDIGFAFDGDGDRCFAVDENGDIIDGDMIMAIIGKHWKEEGLLAKDTIVATVMSNLGFFQDAEKAGINVEQAKVGDRYVMEKMMEGGFSLGGEQSGHIICLNHHTSGDGILAAIVLASIVKETGKPLSQLNTMKLMPQVLKNAKISNNVKDEVLADEAIKAEIAAIEAKYDGNGRVLIRPSGTEPLVRVMIEGNDIDEITADAARLAQMMEGYIK
ncbi:MAG: phosphoglucosamine mutase [Defluviitaleaceae bacterium]|nr:phosphoglucosamine mutase [Defluviitaleaceae bacterium]